jgi:two-component system, NarL family, nitrate/nitrite response regulator NarL
MTVEPPSTRMRVLIVSSDRLTRNGLAGLLESLPSIDVMPPVETADSLDSPESVSKPDVVIWDLGWRADEAIEALRQLPPSSPGVVALVAQADQATAAREAGAGSVLPRSSSAEALRVAILGVAAGLDVRDPSFEGEGDSRSDPLEGGEILTARENEVLQLLAEGLANKAIALRLGIRETTVKFHVNSILAKLGAQSRTEAVARAARQGLVLF